MPLLGVGGKVYWGTVLGGWFHPVQDQSQGHPGACPGPSDAPHRRQLHISVIFDPLTRNRIGPLGTFHVSLTSQSQPLAGTGTGGYRERELQAGSSSQYTHLYSRRRKTRKTDPKYGCCHSLSCHTVGRCAQELSPQQRLPGR